MPFCQYSVPQPSWPTWVGHGGAILDTKVVLLLVLASNTFGLWVSFAKWTPRLLNEHLVIFVIHLHLSKPFGHRVLKIITNLDTLFSKTGLYTGLVLFNMGVKLINYV